MKSLNSLISYFRGRFRKRKEQLVTSEEPPFSALTKVRLWIAARHKALLSKLF